MFGFLHAALSVRGTLLHGPTVATPVRIVETAVSDSVRKKAAGSKGRRPGDPWIVPLSTSPCAVVSNRMNETDTGDHVEEGN